MSWLSQRFFILTAYLRYIFKAVGADSIHSPFVFGLYTDVIRSGKYFYHFETVRSLRSKLLLSDREIETIELGAGSNVLPSARKKVSRMVRAHAKPAGLGELLFRLAEHFKPRNILELGTSVGISTAYLSLAGDSERVITLEGSPATAELARENFRLLKLDKKVEVITGNFDDTLQVNLQKLGRVDLVYFDGNHRKEPTLRYFNQCLSYKNDSTVFIFDDIHWSKEMEESWELIRRHPDVKVSVDLFAFGLVFFRPELSKQDFTLRFWKNLPS